MPSALPRISTVMDPGVYAAIERLASKDGVSMSQKTRDLIMEALELTEDAWLEKVVERRRTDKRPSVSLRAVKSRFGIK